MEMLRHCSLILAFTLTLILNLYAQRDRLSFEHISIEQGISQNTITAIYQDSRGFMWFGTYDGLNRYDGLNVKVYKHDLVNPNTISHNGISSLYEDQYGNLWIGTYGGGLNLFDKEKEKFYRFQTNPDDTTSLSSNVVRCILEDHSGNLWIGTWGGGLERFDRKNNRFIHYQTKANDPNSLIDDRIASIDEDRDGILWMATAQGVCKFDPQKKQYAHYKHNPEDPRSLSNNDASIIHVDPSNNVWAGTWGGGLNRLNREKGSFIRYLSNPSDPNSIRHNIIRALYSNKSGQLLVGTWGGGLDIFDQRRKQFIHFQNNPTDPTSISGNFIYSIYIDRTNILWIGTDFMGINKFDQQKQKFIHYKSDPKNPNSLNNNRVFSLLNDKKGFLWVGTGGGGLNRFDPENEEFISYMSQPDNPNTLSCDVIKSICEDPSGILWIGTEIGLNQFNPNTGQFIRYLPDPTDTTSLSFHNVWHLYIDRSDVLWVGTYSGGLNKFDRENKCFIHYRHDPNNDNSLGDDYIWAIYEDRDGDFWIGTDKGGLNRFDREKEQFTYFQHDPDDSTSISDNKVLTIHEDYDGILWLGTTAGLNRFDKNYNQFINYQEKDGLPSNTIQGILEDNHGNLWISTNNGLSKFDPIKETFQNFNESNGLQSNEFCVNSCLKIKNGEMLFGGVNGFNEFHPDSIRKNPFIPPVVITEFQLFNQIVPVSDESGPSFMLAKSITESDTISLSYKDNVISFEFAALNYSHPENNKFAYMMEGFEKDWNYVGNRNFITYTNLPPGSYNFKVKASNNDDLWNEEGTSLTIRIRPPLWGTFWFRFIVIILLITLIYTNYKFRMKRIQKINRTLEQRVRDRTAELEASNQELEAFAYSISHDLRAPLRGMQGFSSIILEDHKDKLDDKAKDYLKRITAASSHMDHLIDDLLKLSRITRTNINKEKINLSHMAKEITSKLKSENPQRNVQVVIEEDLMAVADKNLIHLALENLFNNAWKFTLKVPKARIEFKKTQKKNGPTFFIKDNGIGFALDHADKLFEPFQREHKEFEGSGIGLTTVQRIIHRHGGRIWAEGKINVGSTFYFTLG